MAPSFPPAPQHLRGSVVLLVGACRNPGREIARALARRGADLVLFDGPAGGQEPQADPEELRLLGLNLRELGAQVETFWGDVRNEADVSRVVSKTLAEFGSLDILLLAFPVPQTPLNWDPFEEGWDTMIDVHLKGAWLVAKWAAPEMVHQGHGTILIDTSTPGADPTCLGGLTGLAHSLDSRLSVHGVRAWAFASLGDPSDPAGEVLRLVAR
jgi:NAD(P)-dependent dehydrogenase (short-subunit alcohol dehydrogenase family)